MQLLRELLEQAKLDDGDTSEVDDEVYLGPNYVPMVKPGPSGKGKNKKPPTTTKAMNSLIQTLWFYNNSDAS